MKKVTYLRPKNPIKYHDIQNNSYWIFGFHLDRKKKTPFLSLKDNQSDEVLLEIVPIGDMNIIFRTDFPTNEDRFKKVIQAIENIFTNELYEDGNPLFWGTQSFDQQQENNGSQHEDSFYKRFMKSIAIGQPDFMISNEDLERYEMGKSLIFDDPKLILNFNEENLLILINAKYRDKMLNLESGTSARNILWAIQDREKEIPF